MKSQEIFNKVVTHMLTQNAKALIEETKTCVYLAPDGKKCAVGCLIKPEYYTKEIEGKGVHSLNFENYSSPLAPVLKKSLGRKPTKKQIFLLESLQEIHDDAPIHLWKEKLEKVGKEYNLKTKVLDGLNNE